MSLGFKLPREVMQVVSIGVNTVVMQRADGLIEVFDTTADVVRKAEAGHYYLTEFAGGTVMRIEEREKHYADGWVEQPESERRLERCIPGY